MRITWYGHSAFLLESAGKKVLVDPFLTGNPTFGAQGQAQADAVLKEIRQGLTHIVVTHGHGDHIGDTIAIAKDTGATIFCNYDLGMWLGAKAGSDAALKLELMNTGGTVENGGVSVTLTRADHSAGEIENGMVSALGMPNGAVIRLPGAPVVWHMGDTDVFSDMQMLDTLYRPEVVIIPIGDRFTMGPASAAYAVRNFLPSAKTVIPCHWGTFGLLTGTPDAFRTDLGDKARLVLEMAPFQSKTI